jgi:hypothetical protein
MSSNEKIEIKKLIEEHNQFYRKAEKFFKQTSQIADELTAPLLNEYKYCARSQNDTLMLLVSDDSFQKISSALEPATRALKCIINDAIDNILSLAKRFDKKIRELYPKAKISIIYGKADYLELWRSIYRLEGFIAESRANLGQRVEIYEEILASSDLKKVVEFLQSSQVIEDQAREQHEASLEESKHVEGTNGFQESQLRLGQEALHIAQKNLGWTRLGLAAAIALAIGGLMFGDDLKRWYRCKQSVDACMPQKK